MEQDVGAALHFVHLPPSPAATLGALYPPVAAWFQASLGEPTLPQRLAWPAITSGENLLLLAPTGSGKSLAAFVPVLNAMLASTSIPTGVRCLYIAPLKALVSDACRSLRTQLRQLRRDLSSEHILPRPRVRTGDTTTRQRRLLCSSPPDILMTTPESLAVMLSQRSATEMLHGLQWIVVDEVHALAGHKRGADLALSLERLTELTGNAVQRIGLSATCAPAALAAQWLTGNRSCAIAQVADRSTLELTIEPLLDEQGMNTGTVRPGFVARLADRLAPEIAAHRSTLIFTNSRGLAERLSWALRQRRPDWNEAIAVHHSALAAARRRWIEWRFKRGQLRAVVSSTSLELGVDIGAVELVVLVHPPGGVIRLLQRVGRSGHGPARTRRGLVFTTGEAELLEAVVSVSSARLQQGTTSPQVEPLRIPHAPRDVLCQQLLGMAAHGECETEAAFALVRRAYPYRDLSRDDFDACVNYLAGRHRDGREWLPARIRLADSRMSILDQRTARILRCNLGTILADEGRPVNLTRDEQDGPEIGEVDEVFADRLQPGDRFLLDGRCLEFRRCQAGSVVVEEVPGRTAPPRWNGEGVPLSAELAERLYLFRARAAQALREGRAVLQTILRREYGLGEDATDPLVAYIEAQERVSEVPDTGTVLIEAIRADGGASYHIHLPLHLRGSDALARVLVRRLRQRFAATTLVADLGFALMVRPASVRSIADLSAEDWRALLTANAFEADLDQALEESELLRERFRRTALTGLMLLRNPLGGKRRVGGPAWAERRLFDQVRTADPAFVLLKQARYEASTEACDAASAASYLATMPHRAVRIRWLAAPSPFVKAWAQVQAGPAEIEETPDDALRRLHTLLTSTGDERACPR